METFKCKLCKHEDTSEDGVFEHFMKEHYEDWLNRYSNEHLEEAWENYVSENHDMEES